MPKMTQFPRPSPPNGVSHFEEADWPGYIHTQQRISLNPSVRRGAGNETRDRVDYCRTWRPWLPYRSRGCLVRGRRYTILSGS